MSAVWTALRTWVVGETVTASEMNTQIRDNGTCFATFCHIAKATTGTIANGVSAAISFDGALTDPTALWSSGAPTRIPIVVPGRYQFRGVICGHATAGFTAKLYKNGAVQFSGNTAADDSVVGPWEIACVAGDYLELFATVNAGSGGLAIAVSGSPERSVIPAAGAATTADLFVRWVAP
jgi:hypothetical protein